MWVGLHRTFQLCSTAWVEDIFKIVLPQTTKSKPSHYTESFLWLLAKENADWNRSPYVKVRERKLIFFHPFAHLYHVHLVAQWPLYTCVQSTSIPEEIRNVGSPVSQRPLVRSLDPIARRVTQDFPYLSGNGSNKHIKCCPLQRAMTEGSLGQDRLFFWTFLFSQIGSSIMPIVSKCMSD